MKCDNIDKFIGYIIPYTLAPDDVYFTQEYAGFLERRLVEETGRIFNVHFTHREIDKTGFTIIQTLAPNTAVYTMSVLDTVCLRISKYEFADTFIKLVWRAYRDDIYRQSTEF